MKGYAKLTIRAGDEVISRDVMEIPAGQVLTKLSVPLVLSGAFRKRQLKVVVEFSPGIRPEETA